MLCELGYAQPATAAEPAPAPGLPVVESYDEMQVDEKAGEARNKSKVGGILVNGEFLGQGEDVLFRRYYTRYEFPRWTLESNRTSLAGRPTGRHSSVDFRKDLRNALRRCGTGDRPRIVHESLNALTLEFMNYLVTNGQSKKQNKNFHPATRVNAALMIGELNQKESARGELPVPLPDALKELVRVVYDAKQSEAVKIAAMVGIIRHAKLGAIPRGGTRSVVIKAMLRVLNAPKRTGKLAAGDAWLRLQAAEVLEYLGEAGANNANIMALAKTVADKKLPLYSRVAAANALGKLNYAMAVRLNKSAIQIAIALSQLAIDAVDDEIRLQNGQNPISRARLKERLTAAKLGLKGLSTAAGVPRSVGGLHQKVNGMLRILDDKQLGEAAAMEQIKTAADKLRSVISGGSSPTRPPANAVREKSEPVPPPPSPPPPPTP